MEVKILVADDDDIFRELICDIIRKQGHIPIEAKNGKEAIDIFYECNDIDLIILDVMMPIFDGYEVLKEIREQSDIPIIMLTALGDEHNELIGLKNGVDDYISKPFSYEIFVARINTFLRRIKKTYSSNIIMGDISINQLTQKVSISSSEIKLNRKEYSLLKYLIKNKNIVLTREKILSGVWGYDFEGDIRTIDTHIKNLRNKLNSCSKYIKTVRGIGYLFEVDHNENN
ncbi:response regulator transcription factor [Clostridium butyricum]|uniref:response regulator transcription factor n=1 Tax=Clostridium butyricum TaxID=1492 RepID=UPI00374ED0EA